MFIGHPHAHPPSTSHVQVLELCAERPLEGGAGGRVFARVSLARHLQDSAQFSQPVIHTLHREFGFMPLPQPGLNLLGPLPPSGLQSGLQLRQDRAVNLRRLPAAMSAFQQARHAARLERIDPVEELPPADADLLGNLRGGQLAAGRQAHGEQSLVGSNLFALCQCRRHGSGQIRSLQMISLGHDSICQTHRIVQSQTRIGITTILRPR